MKKFLSQWSKKFLANPKSLDPVPAFSHSQSIPKRGKLNAGFLSEVHQNQIDLSWSI